LLHIDLDHQKVNMYHETLFFNNWSFSTHLTSSLSDLFKVNTYSDVTLVSDDQIEFKVHKFVLSACSACSACSPVMKDLHLDNQHPHPLIYLRGVKHQEVQSMLEFMYLGEAM
jgi:hypothetical protein